MLPQTRLLSLAAALGAAFALTACGGSNSQPSLPAPTPTPIPTPAPTPTPTPGSPVATGDIAVDGRLWMNHRRVQAGLSALAENPLVNNAAQGHSEYQRVNNLISHDQQPNRPGFTGATLGDRLAQAGYSLSGSHAYGEVIAAATRGSGFSMAEGLITAIHHRFVIFQPRFREIGSGSATAANGYAYLTVDFAARAGLAPGLPSGQVATWPFDGQSQVEINFLSDTEMPDPVPDRNEVGYPISVHANFGSAIQTQAFTVRPRGGADLETLRVLPLNNQTAASIVPLAPLRRSTTYDVAFSGILDGQPVSRQWSFTTR